MKYQLTPLVYWPASTHVKLNPRAVFYYQESPDILLFITRVSLFIVLYIKNDDIAKLQCNNVLWRIYRYVFKDKLFGYPCHLSNFKQNSLIVQINI